MFVYPEYTKVPSVERLEAIIAKLKDRPEDDRNEYASLWIRDLQQELTPKNESADSGDIERDVRELLNNGRDIDAMKMARARIGIGLKEAYEYVQKLKRQ